MKLLVTTSLTQGWRANDFHYGAPGELVRLGLACDRDGDDPDGSCGCARSFVGLTSHQGTTTAQVRDIAMTRDAYVQALIDSYRAAGYDALEGLDELAAQQADELIAIAAAFPPEAVVENRAGQVRPRPAAPRQPAP